jgi:CubicO group peptidase (beta-lactamase class C family)
MTRASRSRFRALALLLVILTLPRAAAAQAGALRGLDATIERAMRAWGVPGVAVAVIKDGKVVHARGYGVRELGKPEQVDERTLFAIGSTSKAFTAAALAMLVDEGRIAWDDRVVDRLPGFQLYDPYVTREIRVRDLLMHSSGLPRGDRLWYASDFDRAEVLRRVRFLKPGWGFRSRYGYQNIMFLAAGQIIPEVTGQSWDAFVAERIFAPLGMRESGTSTTELRGRSNVATPHVKLDGEVRPVAWRNIDNIAPAGSINSSAIEMAQWLRLQLDEGMYDGRRLISAERIREMHTPQIVVPMDEQARKLYPETHFTSYGLAWSLRDYRGRKLVGHGGAIDGMRAEVMLVPEEELGVVVLTNLGGTRFPVAIVYTILDRYLGPRDKDWSALLLEQEKEAEARAAERWRRLEEQRAEGTAPSLSLAAYAGTYADSLYGEVRIAAEDGRLVARAGSNFTGDLEHWHHDTFLARWRDPVLGRTFFTFRLGVNGRVEAVAVEGLAEFGRVPESAAAAASR